MKRALMGGIAAYGASTAGGGLEAAGTEPATVAMYSFLPAPVCTAIALSSPLKGC